MRQLTRDWPWLRRYGITIVFAFVYLLMSLLIVEQDRTITTQRKLIRSLFQDSVELTHLKLRQHAESLRR